MSSSLRVVKVERRCVTLPPEGRGDQSARRDRAGNSREGAASDRSRSIRPSPSASTSGDARVAECDRRRAGHRPGPTRNGRGRRSATPAPCRSSRVGRAGRRRRGRRAPNAGSASDWPGSAAPVTVVKRRAAVEDGVAELERRQLALLRCRRRRSRSPRPCSAATRRWPGGARGVGRGRCARRGRSADRAHEPVRSACCGSRSTGTADACGSRKPDGSPRTGPVVPSRGAVEEVRIVVVEQFDGDKVAEPPESSV